MVAQVGTREYSEIAHTARDRATGRVVRISVSQATLLAVADKKWPGEWCLYNGEVVEVSAIDKAVEQVPAEEKSVNWVRQSQWQQQAACTIVDKVHLKDYPQEQVERYLAWKKSEEASKKRSQTEPLGFEWRVLDRKGQPLEGRGNILPGSL